MVDTSKDEMEKLQKLRTELESRLAVIEDEQQTVEENIKVLREKAAIRELEKTMRAKQDALASLRIEKKELEDTLKAPKLSISEAIQKTKAEIENTKNALETEKEEHPRVIWKKDEQTPEDKETAESDEAPEEKEKKKKLKFF
jgi:prophage DNA circulation protein